MRKGALLLAIMMVASAPTVAFAAKKKAAAPAGPAKYSTTPANSNESSARVFRDGMMQIFVPWQSLAVKR
jgi:hypothetical protein